MRLYIHRSVPLHSAQSVHSATGGVTVQQDCGPANAPTAVVKQRFRGTGVVAQLLSAIKLFICLVPVPVDKNKLPIVTSATQALAQKEECVM